MVNNLKQIVRDSLENGPLQSYRRWKLKRSGTFRQRERFGLIERTTYAYGMLRAADLARFLGKSRVTVCEFGVATGNGLVNMIELAGPIYEETGVEVRVVGFDTGEGLPVIDGYKDHPELWSVGDFCMINREELTKRIDGRAELIFGDIKYTVEGFVASLEPSAPLGFLVCDVDIWSGARSVFRSLLGRPEIYTPAVSIYCDDVRFFFANLWCGELAAMVEFNAEHPLRKIDEDRSLPGHRPNYFEPWYRSMFVCHVLDHEIRNKTSERTGLTLQDHFAWMKEYSLF
jgi:hypothetical protein